MPPINAITTSVDEDTDLNGSVLHLSKKKFCHRDAGVLLVTGATAEGRDDDDDDDALDNPLEEVVEGDEYNNVGMRQSNLFVDENAVNDSEDPFSSIQNSHPPPPCTLQPRGLSLMPSSSPTSSPLENVDLGMHALALDDFAIHKYQIDADEELARQLQEEENKSNSKSKPKVAKSFFNSLLGEPSPWEIRNHYARVKATQNSSPGSGSQDSVSEGIPSASSVLSTFKKWGSGMSAAATDFFGEDLQMQIKRPSASRPRDQYPNAI